MFCLWFWVFFKLCYNSSDEVCCLSSNVFINSKIDSLQEDKEKNIENLLEKSKGILGPNHCYILSEKLKIFFSSDDHPDIVDIGRDILAVADKLEPGLSVTRGTFKIYLFIYWWRMKFLEKILIQLGVSLQEEIGSQLVEFLMNDDLDSLKHQQSHLIQSFNEIKNYFTTARDCARYVKSKSKSKPSTCFKAWRGSWWFKSNFSERD